MALQEIERKKRKEPKENKEREDSTMGSKIYLMGARGPKTGEKVPDTILDGQNGWTPYQNDVLRATLRRFF